MSSGPQEAGVMAHELNAGFDWVERRGPFRLIDEKQAKQYNEKGFLIIEDAFDAETIEKLIQEIDPVEAEFEKLLRDHFDGQMFIARADEITFTTHLVTRSQSARAFTKSAFFQDLCFDLLGADVRLYWDQAVYKKPDNPQIFPWHQDNGYTYVEPQQYLTCWVALTDADAENGCPMVVPGLHRRGTLAHELTDLGYQCIEGDPDGSVTVPVRAGGVVVFSSLTPHKTGPNLTSDRLRKTYIVQFAPDGAETVKSEDGREVRTPCDAPDRQYPILVAGEPVA